MSASLRPSPGRLAAARHAGLRARSRLGVTAALAGGLAGGLYWQGAQAPLRLHAALADVMRGAGPSLPSTSNVALGLVVFVAALAGCLTLVRGRARRSVEPNLTPGLDEIATPLRVVLCVLALAVTLAWTRAGLAGAARAVDAPVTPEPLLTLWSSWCLRGLLVLACAAGGLGVMERLASARRLWQGLHLTPAQARERARALGHRRT